MNTIILYSKEKDRELLQELRDDMKEVYGFNGRYLIDTSGRVQNRKTGRLLSIRVCKEGYHVVTLFMNKRVRPMHIHRLLAQTFIPNPENKPQVNHIDGNKLNNELSNLEWVTGRENMKHAHRTGLINYSKGTKHCWYGKSGREHPTSKKVQCTCTGSIMAQVEAAKWLGVSERLMGMMVNGKSPNWSNFIKYQVATAS